MNPKLIIKIVKNGKRKVPEIQGKVESVAGSNKWSTAVKSWVIEFQKHRRNNPRPPFDRLLK